MRRDLTLWWLSWYRPQFPEILLGIFISDFKFIGKSFPSDNGFASTIDLEDADTGNSHEEGESDWEVEGFSVLTLPTFGKPKDKKGEINKFLNRLDFRPIACILNYILID